MNQLKVQNLYNTLLTQDGGIPPSGDCDFTVATAPTRTYWYIILSPDNALQREIMYYHNVVWNRIYVKWVNRIWAKEHSEWEVVKMNDVAEIFNTFSDMIAQTFYIEKTWPLTVNVWWGYVSYNGVPLLVADTPLTLADNATNYIKYSFDTNTITVDTTNSGNIKAIVVTLSWAISTVEQRTTKESMIDPSLVLLSWSWVPSDSLGTDGTVYINVTNGDFYKKVSWVFVLQGSIQGPQGAQWDPGDMDSSVYDPANISEQVVGITAAQTFTTWVKTFLNGVLGLRNVADTFTSFFTNTNTASRTYTLKDANWTIAFTSDITGTNSGTNTGDETIGRIWILINGSTEQATPADTDRFALSISSVLRYVTWANIKAWVKTYYDSVAATLTNKTISGASNTLTVDGTNAVWFRIIPQVSQSAAYTLVLTDSGKHIYHPSADTTARTWTIPANSSVAFPIGTAITFINDTSAWAITIAITTDTLVLAGAGTTGSRTLAANWIATATKITSTRWQISGVNLT